MSLMIKKESPRLFGSIAGRYDFLNRMMSLGLDRAWRRRMISYLPNRDQLKVLDIGSGTASVVLSLMQSRSRISSITGIDLSEEMLSVGRKRLARAGSSPRVVLQIGDAQKMPFPDAAFDAVTAGFALRNMPDLMAALAECYRVLGQGGRLLVLELSRPSIPFVAQVHALYLKCIVPSLGFLFSGDLKAYQYLSRTGLVFPFGQRFERIIRQAGFTTVEREELCWGAMTIYMAEK